MSTSTGPLAGRNFQDENGSPIVPGEKLGEGGEGVVHLVDGQPGSVMKVWHPGRTPEDAETKIRHLVNNPVAPELGDTWHITWPQHAVLENGVIAGYTMPILNPGESWEPIVEYYNRRAAQTTGAAQAREIRIDDRVRMARNLALGFRAVHNAGYVIGDVNEKNVEVNRQNDIAMVDCDSYGFTDSDTGRTFSNGMGRPEFQAPEAQGDFANRTQNHDLFGLAVIIFHLLTGYQPYTVTNQPDYPLPGDRISAGLFPPARSDVTAPAPYDESWNALTDRQRELFLRCFDPGNHSQLRPSPEEWLEALLEMPDVAQPLSPQPQPQPQPTPTPQRQPPRQPQPRPRPGRRFTVLVWFLARYTGDTPLLYLSLAAAGYGALIPLLVADEFNPWLWLGLTLVAGLLLYDPAQRLLQSPITGQRWFLITVAVLVSAYFLFGLARTAIYVWPWWMWLGMGLATGFVFLVPARGVFNRSNPRKRRVAIGAVLLLGIFFSGSLIWSVVRDYWPDEVSQQAGLSPASANGGASALGNAAPAGDGSDAASGVPVLAAIPAETPTPTPAATPDINATVASAVEATRSAIPPDPTPTAMPTATPTPVPTPTPTAMPTSTPIPTATPVPTSTPTPVPTATPTPRPTATPRPTPTRRPTATPRPTPTNTPSPTATPAPLVRQTGQYTINYYPGWYLGSLESAGGRPFLHVAVKDSPQGESLPVFFERHRQELVNTYRNRDSFDLGETRGEGNYVHFEYRVRPGAGSCVYHVVEHVLRSRFIPIENYGFVISTGVCEEDRRGSLAAQQERIHLSFEESR